jgi:hypothetical protein
MTSWLYLLLWTPLYSTGQDSVPVASVSPVKTVETPAVTLKDDPENRMQAMFLAEGKTFLFRLTGTGIAAHTINTEDPLIFLLQNDSTVVLKSKAVQGFDDLDTERSYKHEYTLQQQDLEKLSRSPVQAMRKYTVVGFDDFTLDGTAAANLQSLSIRFQQMLDREGLLKKVVVTEPSFPGGKEVLLSFFNKNLKQLPVLQGRQQKKATIHFRVDEAGRISQVQVRQSAGTVYDTELLRLLQRMPLWKPGLADGSPIDRDVTLQVTFYQAADKIRVAW